MSKHSNFLSSSISCNPNPGIGLSTPMLPKEHMLSSKAAGGIEIPSQKTSSFSGSGFLA